MSTLVAYFMGVALGAILGVRLNHRITLTIKKERSNPENGDN